MFGEVGRVACADAERSGGDDSRFADSAPIVHDGSKVPNWSAVICAGHDRVAFQAPDHLRRRCCKVILSSAAIGHRIIHLQSYMVMAAQVARVQVRLRSSVATAADSPIYDRLPRSKSRTRSSLEMFSVLSRGSDRESVSERRAARAVGEPAG